MTAVATVDAALAELLLAVPAPAAPPALRVLRAEDDRRLRDAWRRLRRRTFVQEQGLFAGDDGDDRDSDPATRVLVALDAWGDVLGGVRLHPVGEDHTLGWWQGGRLVCSGGPTRERAAVGAALVRRACEEAAEAGALRFDAHVQERHVGFFARLGWEEVRELTVGAVPHRLMRFPMDRVQRLTGATKAPLGRLLAGAIATPERFRGDDAVPLGDGSGTVACVDAILPDMVDGDPEWAGWCGMLVSAHDLSAMGAVAVGALDALGARDEAHARRVLAGLKRGAEALALPILGGHTQLGGPATLSVTGLGRTEDPVPAGGGHPGDALSVSADLGGGWRAGYGRRQWDSSTHRSHEELAAMLDAVRRARPHAAKDVSMAGLVGTAAMLAEASGCGAELEVTAIPRPAGVQAGDWLTCFPGFAMLTADHPSAAPPPAAPAVTARCGALTREPGVRLRWPDGELTTHISGPATGLGPTRRPPCQS